MSNHIDQILSAHQKCHIAYCDYVTAGGDLEFNNPDLQDKILQAAIDAFLEEAYEMAKLVNAWRAYE